MKLRCQIEPSDYVRAQYLHIRPKPPFQWIGIPLVLLLVLVGLQQVFLPRDGKITAIPFAIFGVLAYFALSYGIWLPYRTKKIYKQQKTLQEPYEAELTEEEFVSTNSFGTARIKWADFHKYKVGKDIVLVYQSDLIFHLFPKRWFSDDDFRKLLQILQNSLGKSTP